MCPARKVFDIGLWRIEVALKRAEALAILTKCKPTLARQFGVTRLALFGSTARDVARNESDIDILVAFDGPATSARSFGVQFCLEDLFCCVERRHGGETSGGDFPYVSAAFD